MKHVQKVIVLNFYRLQKFLYESQHSSQCRWWTKIIIFWSLLQSSFLPTTSSTSPHPSSLPCRLKIFFTHVHLCFIYSNDGAQKFISTEFVASQKLLPGLHSIKLQLVCQLFWDPLRRQFPISEGFCSRDLEIYKNIAESSSSVNLQSS